LLGDPGVHHGKPVRERLAADGKQIEVFHLPSYPPELNADERRRNGSIERRLGEET
jgi:hypothetical protein